MAGEAHEGRQQCERSDDHDRNDDCCAHTHHGDDGNAGNRKTTDGDHDRATGDHYRLTGRGDRPGRCVFNSESSMESGSMARDDEQRVIDPDAEADHRGHRLSARRNVHECRQQGNHRESETKSEQGGADR